MDDLKIKTINVRGLRHHSSQSKIEMTASDALSSHVTLVTETHLCPDTEHKISKVWDDQIFFNHNKDKHTNGILLLIKNEVSFTQMWHDDDGRCIVGHLGFMEFKILIVAIYAPANFDVS